MVSPGYTGEEKRPSMLFSLEGLYPQTDFSMAWPTTLNVARPCNIGILKPDFFAYSGSACNGL